MFWPFRRKNRVDALTESAAPEGPYDDLEAELEKLRSSRLTPAELTSWRIMWVAIAFRRGARDEAYRRAREATAAEPDNAELTFALGQEAEYRGEIDLMTECFRQARFPRTSAQHARSMVRYAYLRGDFALAIELLTPLIEAYFEVEVADPTFLSMRGLPFVEETMATAMCLFRLTGQIDAGRALVDRIGELSDIDVDVIRSVLLSQLTGESAGDHYGQFAKAAEAIRAIRHAGSLDGALIAARAPLDPYPWLKDVVKAVLAECAQRFGDARRERILAEAFIERQQLLLEPHWALEFGLIDYQERLRRSIWLNLTGRSRTATAYRNKE